MDKYREYLPQSWLEFIDRDPVLAAAFSAHEYACDSEPVAPFLFQDLRGGEMERLRPIFALYGQPGLNLLRQLQVNLHPLLNRCRHRLWIRNHMFRRRLP